jgi:hypothetical protein
MEENKDYELVPTDWDVEVEGWDVRFLTGEFTETVIRFGKITIDGESEELKFNFSIVSSPDQELTEKNVTLQEDVGKILLDIIESQIANEEFKYREIDR